MVRSSIPLLSSQHHAKFYRLLCQGCAQSAIRWGKATQFAFWGCAHLWPMLRTWASGLGPHLMACTTFHPVCLQCDQQLLLDLEAGCSTDCNLTCGPAPVNIFLLPAMQKHSSLKSCINRLAATHTSKPSCMLVIAVIIVSPMVNMLCDWLQV